MRLQRLSSAGYVRPLRPLHPPRPHKHSQIMPQTCLTNMSLLLSEVPSRPSGKSSTEEKPNNNKLEERMTRGARCGRSQPCKRRLFTMRTEQKVESSAKVRVSLLAQDPSTYNGGSSSSAAAGSSKHSRSWSEETPPQQQQTTSTHHVSASGVTSKKGHSSSHQS